MTFLPMLSFIDVLKPLDKELSGKWATRRPEELRPVEFLELTAEIFGEVSPDDIPTVSLSTQSPSRFQTSDSEMELDAMIWTREMFSSPWGTVWRGSMDKQESNKRSASPNSYDDDEVEDLVTSYGE